MSIIRCIFIVIYISKCYLSLVIIKYTFIEIKCISQKGRKAY